MQEYVQFLDFFAVIPCFFIPPQTLFVVGILFSRCLSVRASVRNVLFF